MIKRDLFVAVNQNQIAVFTVALTSVSFSVFTLIQQEESMEWLIRVELQEPEFELSG